jgi:hypothetical protein
MTVRAARWVNMPSHLLSWEAIGFSNFRERLSLCWATIMTLCVRPHPGGAPGCERIPLIKLKYGTAAVEAAVRAPSRRGERIVSSLISLTAVLAGLCVGMSLVAFVIRLVQHVSALLG